MDSAPELMSGGDSSERVTPRLDRRKRTVSRDDILKQAEQVHAHALSPTVGKLPLGGSLSAI